ncbi:disintegrin and metalloproteinase domain-containing protein 12-like isoform X4 [Leucoraja erinacea]|uniref:disintegrin and metalloproteinase domain-containing protein 12-like isoform X3 n=1 Tax=Leucoraja erinaceus TaxID=7782 RepID=UPI002453C003|nr:disintegrin and metalloproteinase domain-containing protein 12-like isoform X3 [Leucoraja erinacea]XP_055522275.1 disintegrin and metalloproteinase domain-containing protein 12-like isoform X4 [Leucoraja erinacea]
MCQCVCGLVITMPVCWVSLLLLFCCQLVNLSGAGVQVGSMDGLEPAVPSSGADSSSPTTGRGTHITGAASTRQQPASAADGLHRKSLLDELTDYTFVFPYVVSGKRKRSLATVPQGTYPEHVSIMVEVPGERLILDLRRNTLLLTKGFQVSHYDSSGTLVTETLVNGTLGTEEDWQPGLCYYEGSVRSLRGSAVSASTCSGLSALIVLSNRTYVIEHLRGSVSGQHLMYRPEDVKWVPGQCGVKNTSPASNLAKQLQQLHRMKRDVLQEMKYIELVLVTDNAEYQSYGSNKARVTQRMINVANAIDLYYRTFNIRIALIGVEVWTRDQIVVERDAQITLARFLNWREKVLLPRLYNDNAHLILGGIFDKGTGGLASFGSICSTSNSGGVNLDIHPSFLMVSATLAHELGHNLGLTHDTTERNCVCETRFTGCIMDTALGFEIPTMFSSCSREDLENSLRHGVGVCLFNLPPLHLLVEGPECGNMYLEEGEECDCGKATECSDRCCHPLTCKLIPGAVCSSTGACCKDCNFLPAGTVCRPRRGECDLPEFCTGSSQDCPNNHYMKDGYTCSNGNLFCNQGLCQSADKQCQEIWGDGAMSAEPICYEVTNGEGNQYGNCGQNENNEHIACQAEDVLCGKMQCKGGSEKPIRGGNVHIITSTLRFRGVKHECRATYTTFEDASSSDIIRPGTKCGHQKACINAKCQNIAQLHVGSCQKTCNNNGVCNNNGNCFCDQGWSPPYCNSSGTGGSLDSGPMPAEQPVSNVTEVVDLTSTTQHSPTQSPVSNVTEIVDLTSTTQHSPTQSPGPLGWRTLLPAVLVPLLILTAGGLIAGWVLRKKKYIGTTRTENTFVFASEEIVHKHRTHIHGVTGLPDPLPNTMV